MPGRRKNRYFKDVPSQDIASAPVVVHATYVATSNTHTLESESKPQMCEIGIQTDEVVIIDEKPKPKQESKPIVPRYLDHFTKTSKSDSSIDVPSVISSNKGKKPYEFSNIEKPKVSRTVSAAKVTYGKSPYTIDESKNVIDSSKQLSTVPEGSPNVYSISHGDLAMIHPENLSKQLPNPYINNVPMTVRSNRKVSKFRSTVAVTSFVTSSEYEADDPRQYIVKPWK